MAGSNGLGPVCVLGFWLDFSFVVRTFFCGGLQWVRSRLRFSYFSVLCASADYSYFHRQSLDSEPEPRAPPFINYFFQLCRRWIDGGLTQQLTSSIRHRSKVRSFLCHSRSPPSPSLLLAAASVPWPIWLSLYRRPLAGGKVLKKARPGVSSSCPLFPRPFFGIGSFFLCSYELGIPSRRESLACVDYVPALLAASFLFLRYFPLKLLGYLWYSVWYV